MPEDALELDPETMRRMGYEVVDLLVERIGALREGPVIRTATPAEMAARLTEPAPEAGRDFASLLTRLDTDVLPFVGHFDHPRFFGYVPGAGTWPGALGDLIAAATNIDAGAWREAAGPTQLELTVLDWFRDWIGYPEGAGGILLSGGSGANQAAIACARETLVGPMSARIVAYTSDQSHSSIARAARHLGFRPNQIRVLPTDDTFRMRVNDLRDAMDADVAIGRLPFLVAAVAGSTNTGAVDRLTGLSDLCRERGVWLHVDGAYGGFAALTERGREQLVGLDLADSVTMDPHKWLAMPFEVGCLLVRSGQQLEHAFELHPEYLKERAGGRDGMVNFADRGVQLTRMSRALKVWLAIQTFGVGAFRQAIDRALDLTVAAQHTIESDPRLELVTPASLGVLTFRQRAEPDETAAQVDRRNAAIVASIVAAGDLFLSSTIVGGRHAIRLCILNHTSTWEDVEFALERVATEVAPVSGQGTEIVRATRSSIARDAAIDAGWLTTHAVDPDGLRTIPTFATVQDEAARRFLGTAREHAYQTGQHVADQWAFQRTFYVVLEGRVSVRVGEREVNVLGPGDHFGEIAAIDWGRDFSYGRTATVVPTEPTRLLAFPASALRELMADDPEVDRELRRIAHDRLQAR